MHKMLLALAAFTLAAPTAIHAAFDDTEKTIASDTGGPVAALDTSRELAHNDVAQEGEARATAPHTTPTSAASTPINGVNDAQSAAPEIGTTAGASNSPDVPSAALEAVSGTGDWPSEGALGQPDLGVLRAEATEGDPENHPCIDPTTSTCVGPECDIDLTSALAAHASADPIAGLNRNDTAEWVIASSRPRMTSWRTYPARRHLRRALWRN